MHKLKRLAGLGVNIAVMTGLFFAVLLTFDQGWRTGVPAGIAAGVAFGLAVVVFEALWELAARLGRSLRPPHHPTFAGETLVKAGEARHVVGIDTVLGHLYLTNRSLHFRSHAGAGQAHKWRVALAHVQRAEALRVLGLMSSGLRIVTAGAAERFVTDDDRGWSRAIASARQALAQHADRGDEG